MIENVVLEPRADVLIESMRSIGYTFESALADIIDNSISALSKNININFDPNGCSLTIIDDGYGMSLEDLHEAMRWGSKDPLDKRGLHDLGRFGLGLKSASLSQCRKLTVISKMNDHVHGLCWDLDFVRKTGKWTVLYVEEMDNFPNLNILLNQPSGTYVLWENFDKIEVTSKDLVGTIEELLDFSSDYLALVFHQFINEKLSIYVNGLKLPNIDPFLTRNSFTQTLKAEDVIIKDKNGISNRIIVTPYVLPHFSSLTSDEKLTLGKHGDFRNKQGFYIYRNKRLIIWGNWFRMTGQNEIYKNARVKVEIPNSLDEIWSIDVKKSTASIPSIIRNKLFYSVKSAVEKSKKIYTKRAVNQSKIEGYTCIWDTYKDRESTFYRINRELPMIQKLSENMSQEQLELLDILLTDIENNLPRYEIYTNLAQNEEPVAESYENIKNRLISTLQIIAPKTLEELDNVVIPLLNSEPYCKFEKLYDDIMEAFKNGLF